ncbi:transcriptional regulator domain-containing protein [Mesorhizobium muleiense]|uniref:transcriptional regulator domain-containing protein n=1 Tax=Mesorhizobium muleiense TaxID=1004279 RepID=UPI0039B0DE68
MRKGLGTLQGNWTSPAAYAHMSGYEAAEFATEYLVRNDAFVAECSELASRGTHYGELLGPPDFAARWGARFQDYRR